VNEVPKTQLMRSVNTAIGDFAADFGKRSGSDADLWWFVCECGSSDCSAHVELALEKYYAIRAVDGSLVLADGHGAAPENEKPPFAAAS
jgi:hypothetical protein